MSGKEDSINLPAPDSTVSPKTIKIGDSEFIINPLDSVKEKNSEEAINLLEQALKDGVFSSLEKPEKDDKTDR